MGEMSSELMSQLGPKTVLTIPVLGGIPISDALLTTWGIMLFLVILCLIFVRNLKTVPTGPQLVIETIVGAIYNFFGGILGEHGKRYIPYLGTVAIYLAIANTIGVFGLTPPTKCLNVTAALALMSIILVQYSGLHQRGLKGWIKGFSEPMKLITPLNILEVFIRPLTLCMRLFGNMIGGVVIIELVKGVAPFIVPLPLNFYFDIFDGLIQAYVFCFLTSLFMSEAMES